MCKAGFAGDDAPRAVFPSIVGRPRHQVGVCLILKIHYSIVFYSNMLAYSGNMIRCHGLWRLIWFCTGCFGYIRHRWTVLLRTFWSANAYFFLKKNLITSQQISTSTHFLPCLTPHKSKSGKLYPHQHLFNSDNTLTPTQLIWKLKVTCMSPALSLTFSL